MAAGGGSGGSEGTLITWGSVPTATAAPGEGAPSCPSGWAEAYGGYGPFFYYERGDASTYPSVVTVSNTCSNKKQMAVAPYYVTGVGWQRVDIFACVGWPSPEMCNTCRACVKADAGGAVSSDSTIFYSTVASFDGNLGGRSGADAKCAAELPSAISGKVSNIKALLSVSAGDEIRDLHINDSDADGAVGPYESQFPIYAYNRGWGNFTHVAKSWTELLDASSPSIEAPLSNTRSVTTDFKYWTGTIDASGTAGGANCVNWTSNSSSFAGYVGLSLSVYAEWLIGDLVNCASSVSLICAAKYAP